MSGVPRRADCGRRACHMLGFKADGRYYLLGSGHGPFIITSSLR